ncbi:hypothetical protein EHYA_09293 [Embleya hyalina]|uniref:Uncharacterized protein n=1 Tax=Embleya hyalina TaxID=516124 RepID=A0A401Z3V5_9ACTN|nr:hypothetical protein EHYA_09293 [Embleya hyalina]
MPTGLARLGGNDPSGPDVPGASPFDHTFYAIASDGDMADDVYISHAGTDVCVATAPGDGRGAGSFGLIHEFLHTNVMSFRVTSTGVVHRRVRPSTWVFRPGRPRSPVQD